LNELVSRHEISLLVQFAFDLQLLLVQVELKSPVGLTELLKVLVIDTSSLLGVFELEELVFGPHVVCTGDAVQVLCFVLCRLRIHSKVFFQVGLEKPLRRKRCNFICKNSLAAGMGVLGSLDPDYGVVGGLWI
jgi:hypothetical protein